MPPLAFAVAVPLLSPLQVKDVELRAIVNCAGSLMVTDIFVVHPLLSVTVTV